MVTVEGFPPAPLLPGPRVDLEPLRPAHAQEMAPLLDDPRLHVFIGGEPATPSELQETYRRQVLGRSADGTERWLNWVIRSRLDARAVGTVQTTVTQQGHDLTAEVAWVVATEHQRRGYAREATQVMVAWLAGHGVRTVIAHVHPDHRASHAVARAAGLAPTGTVVDGEVRWETPSPSAPLLMPAGTAEDERAQVSGTLER